jgi:DNA-binding CsgD family transcriptional regulator
MPKIEKWTEIYEKLSKANKKGDVKPQETEKLALGAYLIGKDVESFKIMEQAHQGYLNLEKKEQASRCAFWLGFMLMMAGERARGSGWMAKGERILNHEKVPDCSEKGLFLIPKALGALNSGNAAKAHELFEQAANIGEQFGDVDLIAIGRLGHGQALIDKGNVSQGLKLLDETMILVDTESLFPVANGIIYCAVIETCRKVWDLKRAHEWTSALTRWCEVQPDIVPFRGQCLIRRAEIIQFHGEWHKALKESKIACDLLTRPPGEPASGEAFYRQAELLRLLGNFEHAEYCYNEAAKWGRNPQPGLALLRLMQGHKNLAETSISNTLSETKDKKKRSELLPAVVSIMIAVDQTDKAVEATNELKRIANSFEAPYLYGISSFCQGIVCLSQNSAQVALKHLQSALKIWNSLHLPYESARTRVLKGLVYRKLNDIDSANVHFAAARWTFEQLKAKPDLERINQILIKTKHHDTKGLTLRELQVLRRLASGKTNKKIAAELFISERTVDRHVSNIFNKLAVSSRVEATAFAIKNKILDQGL